MANGIEDLMNIRTTGGTQNVPPRPPMGGPPQPQPLMNSGIASMGRGQPPMGPPPEMGGGQPPMGMEEPPMEESMSIEQDAAMLAEATIGRTGGDPQAAVAILDTAKAMLIQGGQEEPMMGGGGQEPMLMSNGGPLYAQEGLPITGEETLKQMIMDGLQDFVVGTNPILGPLDKYNRRKTRLQEAYEAAAAKSQTGRRILSDKDLEPLTQTGRRILSDKDMDYFVDRRLR